MSIGSDGPPLAPPNLNVLARASWYSTRLREAGVPVDPNADVEELARLYRERYRVAETNGSRPVTAALSDLRWATLSEFVAVDEPGAAALLGEPGDALIPEDGDVMLYGDGGAGKTTLVVDLACHLAAGDPWLGFPVQRRVRVALIENEGPRAQFRAKLRRKAEAWQGSDLRDLVLVLEEPWSMVTLAEPGYRESLAAAIDLNAIDVLMVGPVTRSGMNEAGTLQEVRDFMALIADVRTRAGRPVAFVLVHHENKAGAVSGAWEGAGDTLLHVQGQGHGHTRLYVQKARWASSHHATTLHLAWTDGEGFAVAEEPERDDETVADEILAAVLANGGASWNRIDEATTGRGTRKRTIRDRLLDGGRLIDVGGKAGMRLWHVDDPARPTTQDELRPVGDAPGDAPASGPGEAADAATASLRPDVEGTQDAGTHPVPPHDDDEVARLEALFRSGDEAE